MDDTDAAFMHQHGGIVDIGPECFAVADGAVISWRGRNYVPQPETSDLDGATTRPKPNVQAATPGEFALMWNSLDEETRETWFRVLREESERAQLCRMQHGGSWVRSYESVADLRADAEGLGVVETADGVRHVGVLPANAAEDRQDSDR